MRIFYVIFFFVILSCQKDNKSQKEFILEKKNEIISSIYNYEELESQNFSLGAKDTVLIGKKGTTLKIYKNSFLFEDGTKVDSNIHLELKECFDKEEIVLGNLVTLSNGNLLESAGMIHIEATSDGKKLNLASGSQIGVAIPKNKNQEGMMLFQGVETDSTINWDFPEEVLNNSIGELRGSNFGITFTYSKPRGELTSEEFDAIHEAVRNDITAKVGDIIDLDKYDFVARINRIERGQVSLEAARNNTFLQDVANNSGVNSFAEDLNTKYIFTVKNLGWANIDRLYIDPNAEEIALDLTVQNHEEFDYVYTSMIFSERNIYLPGYQKKDKSYSFTHGDYENTILPIGEKIRILATAKKNGRPFFDSVELTLKKEQKVNLVLNESSKEQIRNVLE